MTKYIRVTDCDNINWLKENYQNQCYEDKLGNIYCPDYIYEKLNTDGIKSKRIGNVMFRKATYLGEEPEFPSWHIDLFYPNPNYGKEHEYTKEGDYYVKDIYNPCSIRYHKDCFKHKESCYSIASFIRDEEGYYELSFIGDRPLSLNENDFKDFMELVKYGYKELNREEE